MRFKRSLELQQGIPQLLTVPLVNIVLLVLVFFVLTSSFIMQPGIRVTLPKAVTSQMVRHENTELLISVEGAVFLDDKALSNVQLKSLFAQAAKRGESILIKSDRRASLGRVVEITDMVRESGITQINIVTNRD